MPQDRAPTPGSVNLEGIERPKISQPSQGARILGPRNAPRWRTRPWERKSCGYVMPEDCTPTPGSANPGIVQRPKN
eukprot:8944341-Karenia_brevis.AAC.1